MDDLAIAPALQTRFEADVATMADAIEAHTTTPEPEAPEPEPDADAAEEDAAAAATGDNAEGKEQDAPERLYATVAEWVDDWLTGTIDRRISDVASDGARWCPWWWAHPEGLNQVYLLWQTWEDARRDDSPSTMPEWWDYFNRVWKELTHENGPFRDCRPARLDGDRVTDPARHDGHDAGRAGLLPSEPIPTDLLLYLPEGAPPSVH